MCNCSKANPSKWEVTYPGKPTQTVTSAAAARMAQAKGATVRKVA